LDPLLVPHSAPRPPDPSSPYSACAHPEEATLEDSASDSSADDDSDVPLAEVRAHQETTDTGNPDQVYIANETGGLTSTACAEEVLVESVNGELVDITPLQTTSAQRSQRSRHQNTLYSGDWWIDHGAELEVEGCCFARQYESPLS